MVGLPPETRRPSLSNFDKFAGSSLPSEALVGVISQPPSGRRTLMLPVEPKVRPRENRERPTSQISSRARVSSPMLMSSIASWTSARVKKSRPPKLPDLSAICNSPPFRPTVRMSGTPGAISGPSRNAETPSRSTAAPDVSPPATTSRRTPRGHEAGSDLGQRVFDRVAGFVSAVARLQSRDLFRLLARGDQDRTRLDALFRPVERPIDLARDPRSALAWKAAAPECRSRPPRSVRASRASRIPPGSQRSRPPLRASRRATSALRPRVSARASPSPRPEAPTEKALSAAASPRASRSRSNTASTIAVP